MNKGDTGDAERKVESGMKVAAILLATPVSGVAMYSRPYGSAAFAAPAPSCEVSGGAKWYGSNGEQGAEPGASSTGDWPGTIGEKGERLLHVRDDRLIQFYREIPSDRFPTNCCCLCWSLRRIKVTEVENDKSTLTINDSDFVSKFILQPVSSCVNSGDINFDSRFGF